MSGRVVVLGGGVAGLTAADELSRRGYRVALYDSADVLGGRMRPHAPGALRVLPGYFCNLFETLAAIPDTPGHAVADRLLPTTGLALVAGNGSVARLRTVPWSGLSSVEIGQLRVAVDALLNGRPRDDRPAPYGSDDVSFVAHLLGVVALADRHKLLELDAHTFGSYACTVFAERSVLKPSLKLAALLGTATRLLLTADPERTSARTALVRLLRLLNPSASASGGGDMILTGPATRAWLDHWLDDLAVPSPHRPHPVRVHLRSPVRSIELDHGAATRVELEGGAVDLDFDYVVCALPPAVVRGLIGRAVPGLAGLERLSEGALGDVIYRLRRPVLPGDRRTVHLDTPWALASAEQDGVLAVTVATWDEPSPHLMRTARQCTDGELLDEVWRQLRTSLAGAAGSAMPADRREIVDGEYVDGPYPALVNAAGGWTDRPPTHVGVRNLFLAGDYVRTNADLATAESANESGRRAAQVLLSADGFRGPRVRITTVDQLGLVDD